MLVADENRDAARAAGRLENPRNKVSGAGAWQGRGRWAALEWLRRSSTLKRQRQCSIRAIGDTVTIRKSESGAHFGGVMACGSRICPVCGPRLSAHSREELRRAIERWHSPDPETGFAGGTVVFGTFTIRHGIGESFAELDGAVRKAWRSVLAGRAWKSLRERYGIVHYVRVFEEKFSPATGWHIHVHYLLFSLDEPPMRELREAMSSRWIRAVARAGATATESGQDLRIVRASGDVLADYFTKQSDALGSPDALAAELTLGQLKRSRGTGIRVPSLTPAEVLGLAMNGDEYAAHLWREYENGCVGRRVVGTSHGFRETFDLGAETPDEEVAGSSEAESVEVVSISGRGFKKLVRLGLRVAALDVAGSASVDELRAWLARYGIESAAGDQGAHLWAYGTAPPGDFGGSLPF